MQGIVLDDASIQSSGGKQLPEGDGILLHGWNIRAKSAPIIKDAEMDAFAAQVGTSHSLPEQLFGDNFLELTHQASGLKLSFNARDALRQWHQDALPPVHVQHAKQWQTTRQADMQINNVVTFNYDWTYSSTYSGSCRSSNGSAQPSSGPLPEWDESDKPMDKSILLDREPILMYADIPLYESELDDNGASQLSVKIRVMPSCWFVLMRFWLRVDGVMVRLRDTRLLCKFAEQPGTPVVKEQLYFEGEFDSLRKAGAPVTSGALANAQSTADMFQAIAPIGNTCFKTWTLPLGGKPDGDVR